MGRAYHKLCLRGKEEGGGARGKSVFFRKNIAGKTACPGVWGRKEKSPFQLLDLCAQYAENIFRRTKRWRGQTLGPVP